MVDGKTSLLLRWVLVVAGIGSLTVGVVGVFVPLLPTTPFLLLAMACFFRSSDSLYRWLIGNRVLGPYIRNYRERHAMTVRAKVIALALLWGVIGHTAFVAVASWWGRAALCGIALGVTAHILLLSTAASDNSAEARRRLGDAPEETRRDSH